MAIYAHCCRCHKYHRRGSKIFKEHKELLGMYLDTKTGSRPSFMRDSEKARKLRRRLG